MKMNHVNNYKLDEEEQEILDAFENGQFHRVPDMERQIAIAKQAAINHTKKKDINIRITEHDLNRLRGMAADEGIPYKTLITSILHKYATKLIS
jgi:predicted DNA binding CopG/RHH family protein